MSITSLYSISSNGSSRSGSLERPRNPRTLSIELVPNQAIFRETFLGNTMPRVPTPPLSPTSESCPPSPADSFMSAVSPSVGCTACNALVRSPEMRKSSTVRSKRHAVILPSRHHGPYCRMPAPIRGLPILPAIGEDCLMEWERKGSLAIAVNLPSPLSPPQEAPTPLTASADYRADADYFSPGPSSRFSMDTIAPLVSLSFFPNTKARSSFRNSRFGSSRERPGTPVSPGTPGKDYRSFLRML